ncbi:MAG TPA: hypothetical protein VMH77_04545 [Steroidobacteraceae bacterium]|nr:hypothetical protein [Steroidobacteraceae bacterium]
MNTKVLLVAVGACVAAACGSGHDVKAPTRANFEAALDDFLVRRGDLCLGMFDWPIDLTEAEAGAGSRHAVQLPVLEKLGLVRSTFVPVAKSSENPDGALKRYELTEAGRRFYIPHAHAARNEAPHPNDFCVAHLRRERIVDWQIDAHDPQHPVAVVNYTYRIDPAPWTRDADAQRVFPMVARVVNGAGQMQLRQGFTVSNKGWIAVDGPV